MSRRFSMLRAPTWPGGVERPPAERRTGVDFPTAWARRYPVRLARTLLVDGVWRPVMEVLASPDVRGADRLVGLEDGPVVFAANHASHVDTPLLLTALPARYRHRTAVAAAADYFFDSRWKGAAWAFAINAVPTERTKVSIRSMRLAADLLEEGWSLVIYPEGGRTPDGWGQEHRAGAAWLSARAGAPVVPVHIEGTRRIMRKGRRGVRPSSTTITFGAPLVLHEGEDVRDFAVRIEREIAVLADEHRTDWWTARRRAAAGTTPPLQGPEVGAWRRAWSLPGD
ncbi:MAG TPA: lysophospholipid acyltransferase family protein [Acidimicrobiales bacterium]|nr:lysophospholipid acyltransferase family protein [Acidimicrobiales bacterium]